MQCGSVYKTDSPFDYRKCNKCGNDWFVEVMDPTNL